MDLITYRKEMKCPRKKLYLITWFGAGFVLGLGLGLVYSCGQILSSWAGRYLNEKALLVNNVLIRMAHHVLSAAALYFI